VTIPGLADSDRQRRLSKAALDDTSGLTRAEKMRFALWFVALFPLVIGAGVLGPMVSDPRRWWTFLAFVPMAVLPVMMTTFVMRRSIAQRIARRYIRAGYCPSCGYDLAGVAPSQDGTRCCPECGGVWAGCADA
jgi:hypothetical protein